MVSLVNSSLINFLYVLIFFYRLDGKPVFVKLTENIEQGKSIKKGAVITVKHSGVNVYGTLLYPQFYRERLDKTWKDLSNKSV